MTLSLLSLLSRDLSALWLLLKTRTDEIMHHDISPLCAADIRDQLQKRFAYLSGGRGQDGSPVITFPDYPAFGDVPDQDFQNVMTYLTSIPRCARAPIPHPRGAETPPRSGGQGWMQGCPGAHLGRVRRGPPPLANPLGRREWPGGGCFSFLKCPRGT
ncbi:hypothetical protein G4228_019993 [Cervus hanglu yarkandensis]|uniref:MCF2L n=1 Tax=Cervus hanglu yarkandensis TaxID=84702 RepID=A0A833SE80_9CERV|nr:hypothetical protein G4228_019993 [Cervus hanglu yarkandensis]